MGGERTVGDKFCKYQRFGKYCLNTIKSNEPVTCPYSVKDIKIKKLYAWNAVFVMQISGCEVFKPVDGLEGKLVFKEDWENLR